MNDTTTYRTTGLRRCLRAAAAALRLAAAVAFATLFGVLPAGCTKELTETPPSRRPLVVYMALDNDLRGEFSSRLAALRAGWRPGMELWVYADTPEGASLGRMDSTPEGVALRTVERYGAENIVLDPVMVATSGDRLIEESAVNSLMTELIPMARVITPNVPEAEILSGEKITSQRDLPEVARKLSCGGRVSVMMKAGHLSDDDLTDIFYNAEDDRCLELHSRRIGTRNTHGTGCTLSSAFASYLAQGYSLDDAARAAKDYIAGAIESGAGYEIGHGHGPVDHFWNLPR